MVWADVPMNQAKSNVVNNNCYTPGNPPQRSTMEYIVDGGGVVISDDLVQLETFLRNLAALGQYFQETASVFQATALRIQNLLSWITPTDVPDSTASIPLIFNTWLRNTVAAYPAGCTSRAENSWNYYRSNCIQVLLSQGILTADDMCTIPLYVNNVYNPSTFNYEALLPPEPTSPRCNVPGSYGYLYFTIPNDGLGGFITQPYTILGSGRTDLYGMGVISATSGAVSYIQATAVDPYNQQGCAGAYLLELNTQQGGSSAPVYVSFVCTPGGGTTGYQTFFVINEQQMYCAGGNVGAATLDGIQGAFMCHATPGMATQCAAYFGGLSPFPTEFVLIP
ncbi:hypothetical protein CONPUDRAFT_169072 [Coniophora puteana RWD-64-598 SS2]|uniref:Uncharacterized protein n=1 Tax=Coniophora puteana (strain RWD-64-598) TaxID=741705 RepID=A0A5M3M9M1_CONPW|nr:uncharacterized protein CONPUDRAFT_169072 [Coniophora puteana RWD-64-598 SS2]EIW75803.1 hypothetical protein CONPUDRAFT_169072 [Coniophora puteana RWD-64-598 SS2]